MEEINLFEVWKPITGFENYEVSSEGRVRSLGRWENYGQKSKRFRRGRILKLVNRVKGVYKAVNIYNETGNKLVAVHRLVAEAFIPNPDNLPCINHKDENPSNNCVDNLEWCTYEYNNNYGNHIRKIIESQVNNGRYDRRYSTVLTGLTQKEANHKRYIEKYKKIRII